MMIEEILRKAQDDFELTPEEIAELFNIPLFSLEGASIQAAARLKSRKASLGFAEVHAQVGLNAAPCSRDCLFCSFASCNGVFKEGTELAPDEAVSRAVQFETDGANAIYVMSTADYPFEKFAELSREIRGALRPETVLVANIGDFSPAQARMLKDTGYAGIYHALRMGEGRDTTIPPERRLKTFQIAREAGLLLGTCVEPVGPEHSVEELVEKTVITRDAEPVYSGSGRRMPIPGTRLGELGTVSKARMAHVQAVVRLAMYGDVGGNCTHEPNVIAAAAGANLLWAEAGSRPRDITVESGKQWGMTVADCRLVFEEAEWKVLDGPSLFYGGTTMEELMNRGENKSAG
ncbi:MAG: radical SAM protein [Candidatus Zixiibacteriota bacterium]|nr:MAG: radical SAM protein [candidate division Zixibacteria bacterium]